MKIKISKLTFITFLENIKYTCCTVFVTWRHINLKISIEPSPKKRVLEDMLCRSYGKERSAYGN